MADGSWRADRPPRTVLDVVAARLDRLGPDGRRLVQTAAVAGRDFTLPLLAAALDEPVAACLPWLDEVRAHGLVDEVGPGGYRFVHALTRDAVEASLTTGERLTRHRAVAEATEARHAGDLAEHLADIARHWRELAPHGEATAPGSGRCGRPRTPWPASLPRRAPALRAALAIEPGPSGGREERLRAALGRAAHAAGDMTTAVAAVEAGRAGGPGRRASGPARRGRARPRRGARTRPSTPSRRSSRRRRWPTDPPTTRCAPACSRGAASSRSTTASRTASDTLSTESLRWPGPPGTTARWPRLSGPATRPVPVRTGAANARGSPAR